LRSDVSGTSKGINLTTLPPADLGENVCRCTETVKAEPVPIAGSLEGAPANQSGTHEGSGCHWIRKADEREGECRIGHHVGRKTSVAGIAGEERAIAEVLVIRKAIWTCPAGMAKPWDANTRPANRRADVIAYSIDNPDDLMPGNERKLGMRKFAVNNVKIGPANGTSLDTHADFV